MKFPVLRLLDERFLGFGIPIIILGAFPFIILQMVFFELNNFDKYAPYLAQQFIIVYGGMVLIALVFTSFIFRGLRAAFPQLRDAFEEDELRREKLKLEREKIVIEREKTKAELKAKHKKIKEIGKIQKNVESSSTDSNVVVQTETT